MLGKNIFALALCSCICFFSLSPVFASEGVPLWPENVTESTPSPAFSASFVDEWVEVSEPPFEGMPEADVYYVQRYGISAIAADPSHTYQSSLYVRTNAGNISFSSAGATGLVGVSASKSVEYTSFIPYRFYTTLDFNNRINLEENSVVIQSAGLKLTGFTDSYSVYSVSSSDFKDDISKPRFPLDITDDNGDDVEGISFDFRLNGGVNVSGQNISVGPDISVKTSDVKIGLLKSILSAVGSIPDLIGDMLSRLFIPSEDFITGKIQSFSDQVEEHLGFLGFPVVVTNDFLQALAGYKGTGSGVIHFPGIPVQLPGKKFDLVKEQDVDLGEWFTKFPALQAAIQFVTSFCIFVLVFNRAKHMLSRYFAQDGEFIELDVPDLDASGVAGYLPGPTSDVYVDTHTGFKGTFQNRRFKYF